MSDLGINAVMEKSLSIEDRMNEVLSILTSKVSEMGDDQIFNHRLNAGIALEYINNGNLENWQKLFLLSYFGEDIIFWEEDENESFTQKLAKTLSANGFDLYTLIPHLSNIGYFKGDQFSSSQIGDLILLPALQVQKDNGTKVKIFSSFVQQAVSKGYLATITLWQAILNLDLEQNDFQRQTYEEMLDTTTQRNLLLQVLADELEALHRDWVWEEFSGILMFGDKSKLDDYSDPQSSFIPEFLGNLADEDPSIRAHVDDLGLRDSNTPNYIGKLKTLASRINGSAIKVNTPPTVISKAQVEKSKKIRERYKLDGETADKLTKHKYPEKEIKHINLRMGRKQLREARTQKGMIDLLRTHIPNIEPIITSKEYAIHCLQRRRDGLPLDRYIYDSTLQDTIQYLEQYGLPKNPLYDLEIFISQGEINPFYGLPVMNQIIDEPDKQSTLICIYRNPNNVLVNNLDAGVLFDRLFKTGMTMRDLLTLDEAMVIQIDWDGNQFDVSEQVHSQIEL